MLASRAGEALSLAEVAGGLGRSTATVSYHLQGLVEAGQARLVDGKPRRYTTATPSAPPTPAPAAAAADQPAATATSPSGTVAASGSTGRRGTRGARVTGGRRSTTGRNGRKAGTATGKVAAAGK